MPLTFEEARALVEARAAQWKPQATESVQLLHAFDRVLAHDVVADRDMPPFRRSTRDGYAVRSTDCSDATRLRVIGEVRAGSEFGRPLSRGEAVAIMTGAPLPDGADAVVMVEHTAREGELVSLHRAAAAGDNFVPQGAEARHGSTLLRAGTRLYEASIAVAASVGADPVNVFSRPTVAVLATGDELVGVSEQPGASQIRNSNSYSLAAQIAHAGGTPVVLPIARDNYDSLREAIGGALEQDMVIVSGGVSAGSYDFVEAVLAEFGAEFFFDSVLIQPGKPTVFGTARGKPIFGLPGNPVSTMVTFQLFVAPVFDALSGAPPVPLRFVRLPLTHDFTTKTGLTRFLPARITGQLGDSAVEGIAWQGSGDTVSAAQADCYLVVPPDVELLRGGEMAAVLLKPR